MTHPQDPARIEFALSTADVHLLLDAGMAVVALVAVASLAVPVLEAVGAVKCELCGDEWPDEEGGLESAVDHVRVMHPAQFEEPERWPDGGLVLHDDDPDPSDFTERPER